MALKFPERGPLNLPALSEEWLAIWDDEKTFEQSVTSRPADKPYVFFEGPPSANGKPGIHHVMARAITWWMPGLPLALGGPSKNT